MSLQDPPIDLHGPCRHLALVVTTRCPCGGPGFGPPGLAQPLLQPGAPAFALTRQHGAEARFGQIVGQAGAVADQHGRATGQGFDHHIAEVFMAAGQQQEIGGVVNPGEFPGREGVDPVQPIA